MCLLTRNREAFIAEKDIKVYKVIDTDGFPPYYGKPCYGENRNDFCYKPGLNIAKGYSAVFPMKLDGKFFIEGGFLHAFTDWMDASNFALECNFALRGDRHYVVVEMYIPDGTEYYLSENDREICSTRLFWDKNNQQ